MQHHTIACCTLNRMAERVAVVEDAPQTPLERILHHHGYLHGGSLRDHAGHQPWVPCQYIGAPALQQVEQAAVADDAMFDHLGQSGPPLAIG